MGDVITIATRRQTLADLCEPDRKQDDALLRVIRSFERSGIAVVAPDEHQDDAIERAMRKSLPVSPYLRRPLRTEAEARGKAHPIFESILDAVRP